MECLFYLVLKDTTKELLDQNIIQYIIKKTADLENFQKTLIETIKSHLNLNRATLNDEGEKDKAFKITKYKC